MIKAIISLIGKIHASQSIKGKTNASIIHVKPDLEELSIIPGVDEQVFISEKDGYSKVKVAGEPNLLPENIKKDEIVFGVKGIAELKGAENAIIDDSIKISTFVSGGDNHVLNQLLTETPYIDTSKMNQLNYLYYRCKNLTNIHEVDAQSAEYFSYVYEGCSNVKKLSIKNTSKIRSYQRTFRDCILLEEISLLDGSNTQNVHNTFYRCNSLINFKGFVDLGKSYKQKSTNYSDYKLDLSACVNLTYESLISIINNLYDLNLSYNIVGGGTLYRQSCVLGSTNLAKLEVTEEGLQALSEADRKGWNIT